MEVALDFPAIQAEKKEGGGPFSPPGKRKKRVRRLVNVRFRRSRGKKGARYAPFLGEREGSLQPHKKPGGEEEMPGSMSPVKGKKEREKTGSNPFLYLLHREEKEKPDCVSLPKIF